MALVKLNNRGVRSATTFGSITGLGSMTFIKKLTASSSATLSFVDGTSDVVLDNTYKEYFFTLNNIHPATDNNTTTNFCLVNFRDGGSDYDATKTTTVFRSYHFEDDSGQNLQYQTDHDLAQSTDFQKIAQGMSSDNDHGVSGYLYLYNPSDTTFVKHFMCVTNNAHADNASYQWHIAGYCNTTSAIDGVQFKMTTGNIDAGDICLYGIN